MRLTKDLMIVRAGPRSLHPTWLDPGKARNWDLFICPYEEVPPPPAGVAGLLVSQVIPGTKWDGLKVLLQKWQAWRDYRYVMPADEDLFATQDTWSRFFEKCAACGAKLAQPAFAEDAPEPPLSIVTIDLTSGPEPTPPAAAPPPTSSAATAPPASAPPASAPAEVKRAYPGPADILTQEGPKGLRYDFNDGCRVVMPESDHPWRVRMSDLDTGNILFETELKSGRINSTKRYFIRFRIEVWQNGESLFSHDYSAAGREVLVQFPVGTLGDPMGWFPYAVKFKELHGCKLTCAMGDKIMSLFRGAYPDIDFLTHEEVKPQRYYATYNIGLFFDDKDCVHQPCDFRHVGLHRTAGYILGVDPTEVPPLIHVDDDSRPISEPYVCIAAQSTTQSKYWNNPTGWREIVRFLKEAGYRVICIDQKPTHGHGLVWNHIPYGAEDETGDKTLMERARWLRHCDFFVGLSSGLSWLAWACRVPVVMIAGFTHPTNEFATPYRVINYHACNGCWNDVRHRFDHKDFLYCPRHANTARQFECTRLITVDHVKATLRTIPGFAAHAKTPEFAAAPARAPGRVA